MSNNLVNGFSDIIAAPNLVTNGSFRINQRGNFQTLTAVNVNDYVSDAWCVNWQAIDYCECKNGSFGYLTFSGYGKKGQSISIIGKDGADFGQYDSLPQKGSLTATVSTTVASNSVPITVQSNPKYNASGVTTPYSTVPIVKKGETKQSVTSLSTYLIGFTNRQWINCVLQADGEFNFTLHNFSEINGLFRNPPRESPVNYADDLVRCERYYQIGETSGSVYVPFRTKMAGTPTITLSSGSPSSITTNGFVTSGTGVHTWTAEIV